MTAHNFYMEAARMKKSAEMKMRKQKPNTNITQL
jgi:hypothetical protein